MHDARRKRSGQILIFGAIIIMLLVFSTAIAIHTASTTYQSLHYSEVKELIGNFNDAFRKMLRNTLAIMTQEYNQTAEITTPRAHAYGNLTFWMKTAISTLASRGVQLTFTIPQQWLFNDTEGNSYDAKDLVKLYWYSPQSISSILASYTIDIPSLGFYGWKENTQLFLNVTINTSSIRNYTYPDGNSATRFNVIINREGSLPVDNLKNSNLKVMYFNNSAQDGQGNWQECLDKTIINNGGGNYTIDLKIFKDTINYTALPEPYNKYLLIWVQDTRGIIVEAYTYTHVEYTINENAIGSGMDRTYETYDFELQQNGTLLWFNRQLKLTGSDSYIPIPPTPAKQLRVNVTVNGPSDINMPLSPSQVEVWTTQYAVPLDFYPDYRIRFNESDKLVFFVNYAGAASQNASVSWSADADAQPAHYLFNPQAPHYLLINTTESNLWVVNNSVYRLGVVAQITKADDYHWDLQVNSSNNLLDPYHVEYRLFDYDIVIGDPENLYRIPWGSYSGTNPGWIFLEGPVRAAAYRDHKLILEASFYNSTPREDWLEHTEIILIPYNVSYFQTYFSAITIQTRIISQQVNYVTTISGANYGSAQLVDSTFNEVGIVNGQFANSTKENYIYANPPSSTNVTAKEIGWWTATYGPFRGQATFYDNDTLVDLKTQPLNLSAMYFWTGPAPYYYRHVQLEWAYYRTVFFTLTVNMPFVYKMAGWYYEGGNLTGLTSNPIYWMNRDSTIGLVNAIEIPETYYKMFVGGIYDPSISSIKTQ